MSVHWRKSPIFAAPTPHPHRQSTCSVLVSALGYHPPATVRTRLATRPQIPPHGCHRGRQIGPQMPTSSPDTLMGLNGRATPWIPRPACYPAWSWAPIALIAPGGLWLYVAVVVGAPVLILLYSVILSPCGVAVWMFFAPLFLSIFLLGAFGASLLPVLSASAGSACCGVARSLCVFSP